MFASDEEDSLLQGINKYRTSLNLTAFVKNENAACLADQIAEQYKGEPCTNSTGSNTIIGTENHFPNYPDFLAHCKLNISNTADGSIMPACVPNLDPTLVLWNFTKSQYSGDLNDTKYTGAGIASEGDWIVLVLSTNSSQGSYQTYKAAGFIPRPSHLFHFIVFLMACFFFL